MCFVGYRVIRFFGDMWSVYKPYVWIMNILSLGLCGVVKFIAILNIEIVANHFNVVNHVVNIWLWNPHLVIVMNCNFPLGPQRKSRVYLLNDVTRYYLWMRVCSLYIFYIFKVDITLITHVYLLAHQKCIFIYIPEIVYSKLRFESQNMC